MNVILTVLGDRVVLFHAPAGAEEEEAHEEVPETDLNPIFPELKEITWGFGAFLVLVVLMRWVLYPRFHKGIEARNQLIRSGHEVAEQITAAAQGDAGAYEAQLASARAEAATRIDAGAGDARAGALGETRRSQRPHRRAPGRRRRRGRGRQGAGPGLRRTGSSRRRRRRRKAGDGPSARRRRRRRGGQCRDERWGHQMSRLTSLLVAGANHFPAQEHGIDDQGYTTHHPLWPEQAEIIYGGIASVIVIALLIWKAGPLVKKAMTARTDKIQGELDDSATARQDAEADAARIRQSLGNIEAERQRLLADADAQAEALLADGRSRLDAEVAELEAKAESDIAAGAGRAGDELRAEIARLAGAAADLVVENSLDDATQQQLIEAFIARVGATSPATSGATS